MYLIDSNAFFHFHQRYVYITHLSCHTFLVVGPFGNFRCLKEDSDRLEKLHEMALRYEFNDFSNGYDSLYVKR